MTLPIDKDTPPVGLPLTHPDLLQFGLGQVAYIREVRIMNKSLFAVHAADGTPMSVFDTETAAREAIAENDLEAVRCWLKKHAHNSKTFDAYRREAQRLLMWCVYERGLPLGKLKAQDFEAYFKFLQMPPKTWCASRSDLRAGKHSTAWRPFIAGLNNTALKMAGRVLHSLMNYLVTADYLRSNPLK